MDHFLSLLAELENCKFVSCLLCLYSLWGTAVDDGTWGYFDAMADYTARVHRDGLAGDSFIAGGG